MQALKDIIATSPNGLRPLRRLEYERLIELGEFQDERIELLCGLLVRKPPHSPRHASHIQRLTHLLVTVLKGQANVRVQLPLAIADDSEPEPDVAVVTPGNHDVEHPTSALLVIEVADSSLAIDRQLKASIYATASIPEYWVVNLRESVLEVHTEPVRDVYTGVRTAHHGEAVRLVAFPDIEVAASEVLNG